MNNTIQEASVLRSPSSPTLQFIMDNLSLCSSTAFSLTMRRRWATVLVRPWDVSLGQLDFLCMRVCVSNSTSKVSLTCLRCAISCPGFYTNNNVTGHLHLSLKYFVVCLCSCACGSGGKNRFACTHVSMSSVVSSSQRPPHPPPQTHTV